jgi:predicted TIM-barrel fold metal-dependent hydrolase
MRNAVLDMPIVDTDTHVSEPPDLWTSRVDPELHDRVPQVRWDEDAATEAWYMGDQRLITPGATAHAGWHERFPLTPRRFSDIDPACWNAKDRLAKMDELGIRAQVLYPNIAAFGTRSFAAETDKSIHTLCIEIYNDYMAEWASYAPDRLIPVASMPFWDLEATLTELERAKALGHKGIIVSQEPSAFGQPNLSSRHWDPLWAAAEEAGLSVNFHIGTGDPTVFDVDMSLGMHSAAAQGAVTMFLTNAKTITQLVFGGVCHRFPTLNFVLVESGVGWLPFVLEAMDWQWKSNDVRAEHPDYDLLPSEYFKRQMYGCFWFERRTAEFGIEQFEDNVFYETDFPHGTSMTPGPASAAMPPVEYVQQYFGDLPEPTLRKILYENASRVYGLELSE